MRTIGNPRVRRNRQSLERMQQGNDRSYSSRTKAHSKERVRHSPSPARTPPELTETSDESEPAPMKHGDFFRSRTCSPVRSRRSNGRQPDSPLTPVDTVSSKRGKRTVTTMKRTKKTRSELPQSTPQVINVHESRYRRSLSPQRAARSAYNPEPEFPPSVMFSIPEPDVLFQPKSHKYRTESYKDRYREKTEAKSLKDDYQVDMSRVRSANTPESSLLRPPKFDDEDNLSQASSSIFADLNEEDSTIWGDLEDNVNWKTRRQEHRRRLAAALSDGSDRYGEIRLPPPYTSSRSPFDDMESTGGGITTTGAEDPMSMCVFIQDLLAHDCASFFKY